MVEPSISDVGREIVLTKDITFTARDNFTDEVYQGTLRPPTTYLTTEPIDRKARFVVEETE